MTAGSRDRGHAVVVGGSLAGLCAALALSQDGWRVTVLERSTSDPVGGTGISIDRELLGDVIGADMSRLPIVDAGFPATAWGLIQAALIEEVARRSSIQVIRGRRVLEVRASTSANTHPGMNALSPSVCPGLMETPVTAPVAGHSPGSTQPRTPF